MIPRYLDCLKCDQGACKALVAVEWRKGECRWVERWVASTLLATWGKVGPGQHLGTHTWPQGSHTNVFF